MWTLPCPDPFITCARQAHPQQAVQELAIANALAKTVSTNASQVLVLQEEAVIPSYSKLGLGLGLGSEDAVGGS